jgi:FkbM family methyltransferase
MNIKINNLEKKIETFNVGLSNTDGLKRMVALQRRDYVLSSSFSFNISKGKVSNEIITHHHKSIIGDKVLKFKKKKIVIKIDTEGYENKVLLGIKNLLKNNKILLQIEIFNNNFKKVNKLLLRYNFKLINKYHKTFDYHYINH